MGGGFDWTAIEWWFLLGSTPLEILATACSILGVFLIARQNSLGWPLGWCGRAFPLIWPSPSGSWFPTAFFTPLRSHPALLLGRMGPARRACAQRPFVPTWLSRSRQPLLIAVALAAILFWGLGVSALAGRVPGSRPALLWRDSATTVLITFPSSCKPGAHGKLGWLADRERARNPHLLGQSRPFIRSSMRFSCVWAFTAGSNGPILAPAGRVAPESGCPSDAAADRAGRSESTGKSRLAAHLAKRYRVPCAPDTPGSIWKQTARIRLALLRRLAGDHLVHQARCVPRSRLLEFWTPT
jgi:hypothetical protein